MQQKFFICQHCGTTVAMIRDCGVPLYCCGETMQEIRPGTTDAAQEKHVPVYQVQGNKVTVTISNVCTNWITEETSCVEYICTDAEGNVLTLEDKYYGIVYFGMLEVGDGFTATITLPEGTAKLEFGDWLIRYWTPWH